MNTYEQNWRRFAGQEEWDRHCAERVVADDNEAPSKDRHVDDADDADVDQLERLLSDIDAPIQSAEGPQPPIRFPTRMPGWMTFVPDALAKIAEDNRRNRDLFYPKLRAEQRALYAEIKAAEGKDVRVYRRDIPWVSGETPDDRKRRLDAERYRESVGKTEATVRQYADLTEMRPEERAEHIRERDAKSKREWRKRNAAKRP